jgi:uncharacterized membrane protein
MGGGVFVLLSLGSAALYGAADFIGGLTARRADTMVVVIVSQLSGLLLVGALLPVLGTPMPGTADWLWGTLAGLAGGGGVALLYRALAVGTMSLVAPITAMCAVAVPVVAAVVLLDERPSIRASAGIVVALVAIVLVSHTGDQSITRHSRRGLGLALASGMAIGLFFLALARTSADAGLWPLLFARVTSVSLFSVLAWSRGRHISMPSTAVHMAAGGGVLDMLANLLYLLASRQGPLSLVVTLSSLYPASTVLLAWLVLHERLTVQQWGGVLLALIAIGILVG